MINIATEENFYDLIKEGFVICDFYTTTCVPCKMFSRILEDIEMELPFINIVKINITDWPKIGKEMAIEAVPTVKFYKDGVEKDCEVGLMDEDEVMEKISEYYYGE